MIGYRAILRKDDNDTILVTFPDFPEAATFGDDVEEARARAVDALETIIEAYIRDRRPLPSPREGGVRHLIALPPVMAAKVDLYRQMYAKRVTKTMLAKQLDVHLPQIDRLLNIRHESKLGQLQAAARALGGDLDLRLEFPEIRARRARLGGKRR